MGIAETVGAYTAAVAALGMALLLPLFVSQRRDLHRLREWMEAEAGHPAKDLAASEVILDRAESELELLEGPPTPVPATEVTPVPPTQVTPIPAAQRVTGERPALERITMERAALAPHPRYRRFVSAATQPRFLAIVAVVAVVVGAVAIFASGRLLGGNEPGGRGERPGAIVESEVKVAVLNGTAVPGLGGNVSADVEANGFQLGTVTNSERQYDRTVVMFAPGQRRAANRVAHDLGVKPVQPINDPTRRAAGDADVVVIAGQDRARS